jgi:plasmid stabilization system protein ParE
VRLTVSHGAVADLDRLHEFLVAKDRSAAQRAARTIDDAVRSLTDFPQRGRPSGIAGVRELIVPFGQSAYVVRYAYLASRDEIVILRLWHGREERK